MIDQNDPLSWWREYGRRDAERGKAPLFRDTRAHGIISEIDDPWLDEDATEAEAGAAYLEAYNAAEENHHGST